ncbi:isoleucyl-tRNA synthetase [Chaetomidium leptoderma]|uniref:Isoleucine--tRNA ligase, cytoplasmic n=1 Tax=Chaetomidium leptoderma TaxID=669021 RepID=A0AAN6VUZ0_9PEZI|nr:isoleucyl-tRNA synthetase [Chaetomidium leptoderma]
MSVDFSKAEEEVLRHWREIDAFQTQLRLTQDQPRFTFYDGPPFGLPHYGHLLTSTIKDIIPRYWSMKGYHVSRRFGWDTHGLPIEYEIDKRLGISARDAVKKMGIEKYNAECRSIVMTYSAEWRHTIERLGRWVDFDNDYKSMDLKFMESCWWVFKQLFDNGHVYRAYQIMPYSTTLCTPLSHMESKQNEKMTQDPAVLVSFPVLGVEGKEDTSLVVYTTTPWTLPSNLLIAVHPDFEYMEILDEKTGRRYIMLETMVGWKYKPLFNYYSNAFSHCFRVIAATYVEADQGTGLVHQAPAFGQEDYDAAIAAGFITPRRLPPCPVDEAGRFTSEVPDYAGQHVKTADKAILKDLRPTGRLLVESQVNHVDKFCWRSDTQLIRRAVSSWFIRVTDSIPEMLKNLEESNWVPPFVKEKRFANWISNAHDWNVSRNRYWGTPIPLWVSDDYEEVVCVGSVEELKRLSGFDGPLDDMHRDKVDGITIPSRRGKGVLRRVEEIFDCWFESGSMPYASIHYPFENSGDFHGGLFPADFIAKGLDQTRGWFYTLTILGNKLFKTSPFKNVIVNGIVLAEDGKKMSKSLKNYPDPGGILDQYGSDALRLYLINSPVVRAESMRFKESGVKEIVARVLLPLWNSYRFFQEQTLLYKKSTGQDFIVRTSFEGSDMENVMDRWILADCQSLLRFMEEEMRGYRLYTVVPRLLQVIDNLTNWYIRFNRKRLKGVAGLGLDDTTAALNSLLQVLFTMVRALAPFTPFLTEHIYQLLRPQLAEATAGFADARSVHFLPFPTVQEALFDTVIERQVSVMQKVIQLGRVARERRNLSLKTPLLSLVVIADSQPLADMDSLKSYVLEELNVRNLVLTDDEERYSIHLEARVDWPSLGKKLKKDVQVVRKALPTLSQAQLRDYQRTKTINLDGISLGEGDLTLVRVIGEGTERSGAPQWEPAFADDMVVLLDIAPHPELVEEGLMRDLISRFQRLRKRAGLMPTDEVCMRQRVISDPDGVGLGSMVAERQDMFITALRGRVEEARGEEEVVGEGDIILEEEQAVGNLVVMLQLARA